MAAVPPQIRYLQEGKAIGAKCHKGFVATWNWLLSCIFKLAGGRGVSIRKKSQGKPVIDCLIIGIDGVNVTCAGNGAPYVISLDDTAGGTGEGSTGGPFAFKNGVIGPGAVTVGRQAYRVNMNGYTVPDAEEGEEGSARDFRVKVELHSGDSSPTFTVEEADGFAAPPSSTVSYFPLYTIEDGKVTADWRGTFVLPAFERGIYNYQ